MAGMAYAFIKVLIMVGILVASFAAVAHATAGQATFYSPTGVASACGVVNHNSDMVVAVNSGMYANGGACGRRLRVTCTGGGWCAVNSVVTVPVVDLCPNCPGNRIDLSTAAYAGLGGNLNAGSIPVDYIWV